MWKQLFCSAVILSAFACRAENLEIPYQETVPAMDGRLNDPCWSALPWRSGFTQCGSGTPAKADTRFKVFTGRGKLYFAIEAFEPDMSKIVALKKDHDSPAVWRNDSVEINLAPDPKTMSFYKFILDSLGQYADMQLTDDNTDSGKFNPFAEWNGQPEIKTARGASSWTVEAAIPLGTMEIQEFTGNVWRINVCRHRFAGNAPESSSFARLPKAGTMQPAFFVPAEIKNFKAEDYPFLIKKADFTFRRGKTGALEFHVSGAIFNRTPKFRFGKIRTVLSDEKRSFKHETLEAVKGKSHADFSSVVSGVPPGEYTFTLSVYSNTSAPVLLNSLSRKVKLEYSPLELRLVNPSYRNNLYASMPDKKLSADILLNEDIGIPLTVTLSGGGTILREQKIAAAAKKNRVVFDLSAFPDGKYTLSVSGKGGQGSFKTETSVRKLPYQKGEVWLDADGVTHVDGKKILPFGWYGTQPDKPDSSLNWIILMTPFKDIDEAVQTIRKNLASGQRTVVYMTQEITGKSWAKPVLFAEKERKGGLSDAQRAKIIEFVSAVGKTDGLLAWYMADEPEGRENNPLFYEQALELIREYDPYHPGIMLNYGLYGIRKFYRGADILLPDCYLKYWEDGTTEKALSASSEWVQAAAALRPTWLCAQMSLWPARHPAGKLRGAPPDYKDQRMQFLQAVIHNAKGFSMYTYYYGQIYSSLIIGHEELGQTLQLLREYIFADTIQNGVEGKVTPEIPAFQCGVKKSGSEFCLIAVNTSRKPIQVDFRLKNKFSGTLHEGGGKGVFQVENGRFSDTLGAKESRIYLTDGTLAARIPNVADIERRIREHRAGRLKKGNLIGTGELYEADYLDFASGKIPPHVVRITASSDATFHATKKTGSLYHLVDGLTEPTRVEFTWSPKISDPSPWLHFVLPKKAPLKTLKLYTPGGVLTSCRITAGGKRYEVQDNTENVISVSLDGSAVSEFRIEILKTKPRGRVLSEVELY